jgi:hypothetical protein
MNKSNIRSRSSHAHDKGGADLIPVAHRRREVIRLFSSRFRGLGVSQVDETDSSFSSLSAGGLRACGEM